MKKGLLTITAGLLISLGVSAQYVDANWQVINETTPVTTQLVGLYPSSGFDGVESGPLTYGQGTTYTSVAWDGDVLGVAFTNPVGDNWADFGFITVQWVGGTGKYFTTTTAGVAQESDAAKGYTVDFSDDANAYIEFKVQASAALNLRVDVGDLQGKLSNGASPYADVAATAGGVGITDATKWVTLTYNWSDDATASAHVASITDMYSGAWWGINNTGLKDADNPLDKTTICKIAMTIDDGSKGTDGDTKTLYIKDLKIGVGAEVDFEPYVGLETISGAELQVVNGVVYSAGTITVTSVSGQVVATADGELNIASLPAGVLVITAAEGSAKIVK